MMRVCVLVLGDFGRSPRMQYHTLSLANQGVDVDVVALPGSLPRDEILQHKSIKQHLLWQLPNLPSKLPRILFTLYGPLKVIIQTFLLFFTLLFTIQTPDFILFQNPPGIPTIFVVLIVAKLKNIQTVCDWHNLTYSLLSLNIGENHILTRLAEKYERYLGRFCDYHFCVTKAMRNFLYQSSWGKIKSIVLYDKPPAFFKRVSREEKVSFFKQMGWINHIDMPLVVSSTSWSEDEDFSILLNAIQLYDYEESSVPCLFVISGKGPLRAYYEKKIAKLELQKSKIFTVWLHAKDYPTLLGSADLGVSLHTSTSGKDLPMKVVDMFGCLLPVCAYNFSCLDELVHDHVNGIVFNNESELLTAFRSLLNQPNLSDIAQFRKNIEHSEFIKKRWEDNWNDYAWPIFSLNVNKNRNGYNWLSLILLIFIFSLFYFFIIPHFF